MWAGGTRPCSIRHRVLVSAVAVTLLPVCVPAQEVGDTIEEVVVTGSRIPRRDFVAPSPITTIDRSMIDNSGQPTLESVLNQMPQVIPDFGRTSNNPGNGTSRINLRGMGSNRTLVLLNGRRLAPSGIGSSVDVNNLPQILMDRVELITGGATTVYGSDAVAGVVNFIMRDDFDGFGLDASAYVTETGDSEVYDLNATWGHNFASGRGNITLFGGYLDRRAMFAADRDFTSVQYQEDWQGNVFPSGSSAIPQGRIAFPPIDIGNGPVSIMFTPDGNPVEYVFPDDLYNFQPVNYLQIPLRRYSGGAFLNYDITGTLETYVEVTYTRNEADQNLAPVPVFMNLAINLDNPVLTPATQQAFQQLIPLGNNFGGFSFRRRMEELGFRIIANDSDYSRMVVGLRGELGSDWHFDVWATYTRNEEQTLQLNDGSASRLQQGLLVDPVTGQCFDPSGGCVALNVFGAGALSPEGIAFLKLDPLTNVTTRTQKLVSGYVRGPVFDTWAGPVDVAVGAEWRSDDGEFRADEQLFSGDALGFRGDSSVVGEESVSEIYAEALVPLADGLPLARSLSVEVGGRYSRYDKAGSVDTWKFGGEWTPVDALQFRMMWQRSVRAPDLNEAFRDAFIEGGTYVFDDTSVDPCSASADPVGRGNVEKCVLQGLPPNQVGIYEATPFFEVNDTRGGNVDLTPEIAETRTAGVVFSGFESWTLSFDWFDLEVTDAIREPIPILTCFNEQNTANTLCDTISRNPATGYNISDVDLRLRNLGILRTKGFDAQISYGAELPSWLALGNGYADLGIDLIWTHMTSNTIQEQENLDPIECAGYFGFPCNGLRNYDTNTFAENRTTTNIRYGAGKFDAHLAWRWIEGTRNAAPIYTSLVGDPDPVLVVPDIGSKNYFDLGFGYSFTPNISARLNILNLLDVGPPFMADAAQSNNTDTTLFDIFGRSYQLTLSLRY